MIIRKVRLEDTEQLLNLRLQLDNEYYMAKILH